jgi:signal transduction histidine kinase
VQTSLGLKPLAILRHQLTEVRSRRLTRLDPNAPLEVRPLVSEVNELLAAQEDALARARARAADLAHALKTPLAVLSTIARELEPSSSAKEAEEIMAQVGAMQRRIDHELARARLRTDRFGSADLSGLIKRLADLMRRTPRGRDLEWTNEVDPGLMVAADEVDAAEAIGNVLENACRWAGCRVAIATRVDGDSIVVTIEDDGPGVPDHKLKEIVQRGTQLDDNGQGAGLGLAIANEILLAYGGGIRPLRSSLGGLRIEMTWPQRHGSA